MKNLSQLALKLLASWGVVSANTISSLPGKTKYPDVDLRWLFWTKKEFYFNTIKQPDLGYRVTDVNWQEILEHLLGVDRGNAIAGDPNEIGRLKNNIAVAAFYSNDFYGAVRYISEAASVKPNIAAVVQDVGHNQKIIEVIASSEFKGSFHGAQNPAPDIDRSDLQSDLGRRESESAPTRNKKDIIH